MKIYGWFTLGNALLFSFVILGLEPKALHILDKCSTEVHSQTQDCFHQSFVCLWCSSFCPFIKIVTLKKHKNPRTTQQTDALDIWASKLKLPIKSTSCFDYMMTKASLVGVSIYLCVCFAVLCAVLEVEFRDLCLLGKHSTTELQSQPSICYLMSLNFLK
jgi:hypothetical protein